MSTALRVLVVEDSEDDALLLLRELRRGGWDVTHRRVDTAVAMTEALDSGPWDVVIADYAMPQFSGPAALALARQQQGGLPFILVSGTVGEATAVQAMRAGADDYLFKGNLNRLCPAVERELRESESRRKARRIEQELQLRDGQLADAQRLARIGAWRVDLRNHTATWSDETYRILGRQPGAATPTLQDFLGCLHPDDHELFTALLDSPDVTMLALDLRTASPNGGTRFVHVSGEVVRAADGSATEAVGMIQDITERKRSEQDLQEAHRELQRAHDELALAKDVAESANRAKDHFIAVLSHELRTPLTPILALVSQLQRQTALPAELQQDLAVIRRNVEAEARLIDELLELTRVVRGKIELHFEVVDAHAALCSALDLFQREANAKGLTLTVALHASRHHVWADAARLRQVFGNVLSNAVKFTPRGGSISVTSTDGADGTLNLRVIDTGIGIEPEALPRLFNRFEQGDPTIARRFGGLGLGLAIAKSMVEMQAGKISAASAGRDKGAELHVAFKSVPNLDLPPDPVAPPATAAGAAQGPSRRILLVEDHADTRRVMTKLLGALGYAVLGAGSVKEALEVADKAEFDLLISDIGLPDGTGHDVIRHLKERRAIKGIAVSGFGQDVDFRRSREAGFETHLAKPIDFDELHDAIRQLAG